MRRRPGIAPLAATLFAVAFAGWTALALGGDALAWLDAIAAAPADPLDATIQIAAALALLLWPGVVYTALAGIALWAWQRRLRNLTLAIGLAIVGGWLGGWAWKQVVRRPRPAEALDLITSQGFSYPSGHLIAVMTAAIVVIATTTTTRQSRGSVTGWRIAGLAAVGLVGWVRWVLHAHHLTDVVGGALWGGFTASLALTIAGVHMLPEPPVRRASRARRRCAVIVNPTKVGDWASLRRHVEFECAEHGWTPLWLETTPEDPGRGMAKAALRRRAGLVLVAGGDGTVRAVCSRLAGTGIPLALIPSGTGNLLARNLGVPLDESEALAVAFGGQRRTIDLVEIRADHGRPEHCAVMAGLGLDARIMRDTSSDLKKIIGPAAYVMAATGALGQPSFAARITLDDAEPLQRAAGMVLIGNVGALQGNVQLLPEAQIDDGLLDLLVASPRDAADWVRVTTSALLPIPDADGIDRGQGRRVLVEVDEPVAFQLDGDAAGECRRLEATLVPRSLVVMTADGPEPLTAG